MTVVLAATCSRGTLPVVGYPWVEHRGLSLENETLLIDVGLDEVTVDVLFEFALHGEQVDSGMFFPIPGPGGETTSFEASLVGDGMDPLVLDVHLAEPSKLPAGEAVQTWDLLVPGDALTEHGGMLRVTYTQSISGGFEYILKSGAYWKGPIGTLVVVLTDGDGRVESAAVEGQEPHGVKPGYFKWYFKDLEPRSGVVVELIESQ